MNEEIRARCDVRMDDFFYDNHESIFRYIKELHLKEYISIDTETKNRNSPSLYVVFFSPPFKEEIVVDIFEALEQEWFSGIDEKDLYLNQLLKIKKVIDSKIENVRSM